MLSLVQKGQTSQHSGHSMEWNSGIWWWGHSLWCKKVKPVDAVDTVCSMQWNSGIWWWGHCLWCKKVKPVDAVDAVLCGSSMQKNTGIWSSGHCLWCKKFKQVDAVNPVHSGCSRIVVYGGGDILFGTKRSN